jgi:hypothetical protein
MQTTDYIIDIGLILLVLVQIKERPLTTRELIRPLILVGIAVLIYLKGIPTAGNDLVLVAALTVLGGLIGVASGQAVLARMSDDGSVLARAGWLAGLFWVLGMGSRMAFVVWMTHGGHSAVATFSAQHSITSGEAWTAALLGMAVAEVLGRTLALAARRSRLQAAAQLQLA